MICPYCSGEARLTDGSEIYPHRRDLWAKSFYRCQPCNAYVGCHPGTTTPLGTVANAETRRWRNRAHEVFDPLWRSKTVSRSEAYAWLREKLNLSVDECHIAMFTPDQCRAVIEAVKVFDVAAIKPYAAPVKKPHRCLVCRKGFATAPAMNAHTRDAHKKIEARDMAMEFSQANAC